MTGRTLLRLSPIALVLVAAACGGGGKSKQTVTVTPTPVTRVVAYFLADGKVQPATRFVPQSGTLPETTLLTLQDGLTPRERALGWTTAIVPPVGSLAESPTTLTLTLNGQQSHAGLAQVYYTLAALPGSRSIVIDGKRYTAADFEDVTPAILVESPLPFARVSSPLRATGTANTFEATFQYELKDAAGKVLATHFVTATSGNGVRGTFAVTIPFAVAQAQKGTLSVFENSAATGKRVHESDIPLTLQP